SHGQQDPLHIISVQPVMGTSDVDLVLAMERPEASGGGRIGVFYSKEELSAKLEQAAAKGQIGGAVVGSTCSGKLNCGDKVCDITVVMEGGSLVTYSTERVSLVSPRFSRTETCICPGEHSSHLCEGQSCPADMQCVRLKPFELCVFVCCDGVGQTSLSFSGNSYIKYRVTERGQSGEMRLGLRIRTLQRRGVIMFTRVNPCTMLKIEGGRLWFQLDCDNTLGIMGISDRPINDGLWHSVALELMTNYTLLSLDDSYVERRRAARAPVSLWPLASDPSFFFGAQVRPVNGQGERTTRGPQRAQDGFQGCLGSLMLNGNELPLQNKRSRYAEIAGLSEVKLGCMLYPDPCVSRPCLNGALCSSLPSGVLIVTTFEDLCFMCSCSGGFTGELCDEDVNECDRGDCENGGECINTFGSFYCNCSEGYEGQLCDDDTLDDDTQAEPLSYIGPGEIIGIGVLAFVIILLLILFVAFRKKIKFRKESDPCPQTHAITSISAVSTETRYMLRKTGIGVEGIEFKAVRVSDSPGTTSTYGEVGSSTGGPPQVVVRPNAHSALPGVASNHGVTTSDDKSGVRGVANRRGIAVCSVAPNLPSSSSHHSEHSPPHKVSWEGKESREKELERLRNEREEEWGQRAFELARTHRDDSPQGKTAALCAQMHAHRSVGFIT
uniref:Uncharacterized protein n=1 Tax=Oryzias latipes TaxID=8090 RepID=A0A3B3IPN9_ORYLA